MGTGTSHRNHPVNPTFHCAIAGTATGITLPAAVVRRDSALDTP